MNVSFNPAFSQNSNRQNIQFQGDLGNNIVRQITKGEEVLPETLVKEVKGKFGVIKTEKVSDIFESLINKVRDLFKENKGMKDLLDEADKRISRFPREKDDAVYKAEKTLRDYFASIISNKDSKIAEQQKEIGEMSARLKKYEPMSKVKSIEEIGVIMPERAKEILSEVVENRVAAYQSMEDFLFNGKGQQAALDQLGRLIELSKAQKDGIFAIPEMDRLLKGVNQEHHIYISSSTLYNMRNMIEQALRGSKNADYLESSAISTQVKNNAMALLSPHANEKYSNESIKEIERELDKTIKKILEYRRGFTKGIEKLKQRHNGNVELKFEEVPYNYLSSKVLVKPASEPEYSLPYYQISDFGSSNWS